MRLGFILATTLLAVSLLSCSNPVSPGTTNPPTMIKITIHSSCSSSTGQPTTCTLILINDSTSNATFNWVASSDPVGATFSPSSGSVAPGVTDDTIQVSIPHGMCPDKLKFIDNAHQTEVDSTINTACQ